MSGYKTLLKRRNLIKALPVTGATDKFIQPFKEMPSVNDAGQENTDRIDAHELFSFYTADIIKEEVVFVR